MNDEADASADARTSGAVSWSTCLVLVLVGSLGGAAAWYPLNKAYPTHPFVGVPKNVESLLHKTDRTREEEQKVQFFTRRTRMLGAGRAFAFFTAIFTGVLGAWAGLDRRSLLGMIFGTILGVGLGGVSGVAAGAAAQFVHEELIEAAAVNPLFKSMAFDATAFAIAGIGAGAALGLLWRRGPGPAKLAATGIIAGILVAMLFTPIASVVFAGSNVDRFIPVGSGPRFLWLTLAASLTGLMFGLASLDSKKSIAPGAGA